VEKPRPPGEVIRVPIDGAIEVTRADGDFAPPARTGVEKGFTTIFLNVGRKHLVTPADIVGKVARQASIAHRMPAIFDDKGFARITLQIRERFG
jgi:hypothetical protein